MIKWSEEKTLLYIEMHMGNHYICFTILDQGEIDTERHC